jgi:hypothetical protein
MNARMTARGSQHRSCNGGLKRLQFLSLLLYMPIASFGTNFYDVYTSIADSAPGSEMGKKSRIGSGMNILDHISESLETIFWVKNT